MIKIIQAMFLCCLIVLSTQAQAGGRLEKIKSTGEVRVCIWPGYFAISYRNPRNGMLEGIDIDMAKDFADHLGVKLTFVDSSFGKIKENMTNGACDISMHGVGVRDDRKPFMDFSEPHLISGIYAVSMKSNDIIKKWDDIDQEGNVVVVQKGTYMEPVMRDYLKKAELSVVDSFKAREQEVEAGRADVFMTDYPYGKRMAALTTWAHLMEPAEILAPTPYAYAVPKNEPDWLGVVNDFLATVKKDGRLAASAEKHGLTPIVAK
ncbi:ABC transporter substrate-binding protein [Terasakiella sp. A23]|uniref:substrate-binding periplasmic protein n=1 Tax=Terasakiella sp. FCG-A23 TaxID=3080561 RepID=UPI0029540430|nr:ABC transporter substrate-binding protein [Terasakiella sp. A23]MDV7338251.1 ABC transporter substrate-binding protein [Terasakiella sp. A23]